MPKLGSLEIPIDEKIDITMANGNTNNLVITKDALNSIETLVSERYDFSVKKLGREYVNRYDGGTFVKRLLLHARDKGIDIDQETLSKVGIIVRENLHGYESSTDVAIDFTQSFDWVAGDFGDRGSCYWSDRRGARMALENCGSIAIRFYERRITTGGVQYSGFGRAWLIPYREGWILFNAYGPSLIKSARVISDLFGLEYKQVRLSFNGTTDDYMWINNDGKSYMIGYDLSNIVYKENIDIEIEYDSEGIGTCESCGEQIYFDETLEEVDGMTVCGPCFDELQRVCGLCGETFLNSPNVGSPIALEVCFECLEKHPDKFVKCSYYRIWIPIEDSLEVFDNHGEKTRVVNKKSAYFTNAITGELYRTNVEVINMINSEKSNKTVFYAVPAREVKEAKAKGFITL